MIAIYQLIETVRFVAPMADTMFVSHDLDIREFDLDILSSFLEATYSTSLQFV